MKHLFLILLLLACEVGASQDTPKADGSVIHFFGFVKSVLDSKSTLVEGAYTWSIYYNRKGIAFHKIENNKESSFYLKIASIDVIGQAMHITLDSPVFKSFILGPHDDPKTETMDYAIVMSFREKPITWMFKPVFERDIKYPSELIPKMSNN